jgi:hypothetical protein
MLRRDNKACDGARLRAELGQVQDSAATGLGQASSPVLRHGRLSARFALPFKRFGVIHVTTAKNAETKEIQK